MSLISPCLIRFIFLPGSGGIAHFGSLVESRTVPVLIDGKNP
jgi:hypothetical protein